MRILNSLQQYKKFEVMRAPGLGATVACVALIGSFWALTLVPGHNWTGDFSQYIHHAANVASGVHYADTGYIVSNSSNFAGPYVYPPVFPLLMAPVIWVYGLDLEVLKTVVIVSFCLYLLLMPQVFGRQLGPAKSLLIIFLVGVNPTVWSTRNEIHSEFTFMFFTFLALWLMQRKFRGPPQSSAWSGAIGCLLLGLVMYLAYGSRTIGLVLPLCVIGYELVVRRKLTLVSLLSVPTFILFAYVQHQYLQVDFTPLDIRQNLELFARNLTGPSAASLVDLIDLDPKAIFHRLQNYRWALQHFFPVSNNALYEGIITVLFNLSILAACWGYVTALRRDLGVIEIFCAGYVAVLLLFGAPAYDRYLFPLFPFFLYYALIGYDSVFSATGRSRIRRVTTIAVLGVTAFSYAYGFHERVNSNRLEGVTHPDALSAFEYIRGSTPEDATIVARNPRVVALFTHRRAIGNVRSRDPSAQLINDFYVASGADYYLHYERKAEWIQPLLESSPPTDKFTEVFRNSRFVLYRFDGA